ncbi:hypothetical protein AWM75_05920 [Aerococcus urinaehominis]|uniref:Uncharacterized protein n=1 Tax=Aerococcus urinaehominis TaxID=128944 RepID=A0A109RH50_9LACT|nr:LCP family protein [Aerococcus urinaehominis]AMB99561.1 hypothetical protein AWM75_05920 [Aerococcus urinaehominis]SDM35208.1 transcriptional attenuator, LytR family [Aerococcus urinaehominis]
MRRSDKIKGGRAKSRRSKWWLLPLVLLVIVLVGLGSVYFTAQKTADQLYESSSQNRQVLRDSNKVLDRKEPVSILLLGMDSGGGRTTGERNTDVMILVTINPNDHSAKMLSIPRDTYSQTIDDKINAAYAYGGSEGAINAVQDLLNIPVDYYALVNMDGMMSIIDAVGPIQVYNNFAFANGGYQFPEGEIELSSGDEALEWVRMRYEDPEGDYGRNRRQREILLGILRKYARVSSLTDIRPLLDVVTDNVRTDMTLNEMVRAGLSYRVPSEAVEEMTLIGQPDQSTGVYYNIVGQDQLDEVSQTLRSHLELD